MTKGETLVITSIGFIIVANNVAGAVIAADANAGSQVPLEATIIGIVVVPVATLIGLIFTFIRVTRKVTEVSEKSDTIILRAVDIYTIANAKLEKITAALDIALEKISNLEQRISKLTDE